MAMLIDAVLVKELRQRTGAGMMECKKALLETEGQIELAVELLRKKGSATAEKRAGRIAAEGVIAERVLTGGKSGVLVEVNCETDFVARDGSFKSFAATIANAAISARPKNLDELLGLQLDSGGSIEQDADAARLANSMDQVPAS